MPATPEHYAEAPETLVVSLAVGGDRVAFAALVLRRQSWLRNFMRRLCHDVDLADDLAQSVLLKAWRTLRQLQDPDRFGGWLARIAVREWIDHQRKHGVEWHIEFDDERQPAPAPTDGVAIDIDAALATLPEPVRLCVVASYHQGMSHREIAELADLPEGTVKSHIRRGSRKLQALLAAYEGAP